MFTQIYQRMHQTYREDLAMEGKCILALMVLCVVTLVYCDTCAYYDVNGCSTPLKLPFFYKRRFTPSCNRHDICYRCANRYGISRTQCDDVFHEQMRTSCQRGSIFKRTVCKLFAKAYYNAVKRFGRGRYRRPSKWYCGQSWVQSCLPSSS